MRLAFYAPLKPPDHPVPSGDRAMAQSLIAALETGGATVDLASRVQTRDGKGSPDHQAIIAATARAEVAGIIAQGRRAGWQAWITYHNYYKAPDLIGPHVAAALDIPYLLIESTRARKRLTGPWAGFAHAAEAASDAAQVIFHLTDHDARALRRDAPAGQHLIRLRPFLNRDTLPDASTLSGPMLAVGMMRHGDKLASYRIIADTLALLPQGGWRIDLVGNGPAQAEVAAMMAPFGDAVRLRGRLEGAALERTYGTAALFFWPGVNEAFGLSYLEAQAAGLPVVAQQRPGVCDVLPPDTYPTPESGSAPLAARISDLLRRADLRQQAGQRAREMVCNHHLRPQATQTLLSGLECAGLDIAGVTA